MKWGESLGLKDYFLQKRNGIMFLQDKAYVLNKKQNLI